MSALLVIIPLAHFGGEAEIGLLFIIQYNTVFFIIYHKIKASTVFVAQVGCSF